MLHHLSSISAIIMLILGTQAWAELHNDHDDEHNHDRSHHHEEADEHGDEHLEAHVHGIAELLLVLEDEQLNIQFVSPAMNIVGFEHSPKTEQQKSQVSKAKTRLEAADKLFQITSGNCKLTGQQVNLGHLHRKEEHHHDNQHSDIEVKYQYHCRKPDAFNSLSTTLSQAFPAIDSLQVQWIISGQQGAATLNKDQTELSFR